MNKQIIIYLTLGVLLFSCKLKKEKKTEAVKTETAEEVITRDKIDLNQIMGNYSVKFIESFSELNEVNPTIIIDKKGNISGNNGCNSFFGQLNLEEDTLIKNLGSTRRACRGEENEVERVFMAELKRVTNIKREGNLLSFFTGNKKLIEAKEFSLEGGVWEVLSIEGKEYEKMPSFEVNNNRMDGNTGCNSFFGMLQQNGTSLSIIDQGMTEMDCPNFEMAIETKFIIALTEITEFKHEGSVVIFLSQGKELFRAQNRN